MTEQVWKPLFEAPHDRPVRLFLPCVKFDPDEKGRPKPETVEHSQCVGIWDAGLTHWVDRDTGRKVYPSGWQPVGDA